MKDILILTADSNGAYPVPAIKGGAVSTLVEHLAQDNETKKQCNLFIVSFFDRRAVDRSLEYKNTRFVWVKIPRIIKCFDWILFKTITVLFPRKKALSYKSIFSLLWYIVYTHFFLKKHNFDKVIIENNVLISLSLFGIRKKYEGKYYYHFHNIPRINFGCKKIVQHASRYICVSKYVGTEIEKEDNPIGPVDSEKIRILKNCVDKDIFNITQSQKKIEMLRNKYQVVKGDKVVIFTGRISPEKGIDQVIKSFEFLEMRHVKLLIVGSYIHGFNKKGRYQKVLDVLAEKNKVEVIYTGYIDQHLMKYYYQLADVAVLPSMWEEPAGLTMLEAMACGIPVVTTYSGGIPEYVDKDAAVLLLRDDKLPRNIATAVDKMLIDADIRKIYSERGRKLVNSNFLIRGYMGRLLKNIKD